MVSSPSLRRETYGTVRTAQQRAADVGVARTMLLWRGLRQRCAPCQQGHTCHDGGDELHSYHTSPLKTSRSVLLLVRYHLRSIYRRWSCTFSLRLIPTVCKPGKMPSFQPLYERVLP